MSDLAPGFLVASPSLQCPFFHHTVVLLVDHSPDGSFGFVINKPSTITFAGVTEELDLETTTQIDVPVFSGGPVSPETGWVVFDPRQLNSLPEDAIVLSESVAVSASLTMLHDLAAGTLSCPALLSLGYAGWSEDQLEDEMREGSWIPIDLDPQLTFEVPIEDRWRHALGTLGIDPARMVGRSIARA
ncbi:MAG: YqgE/AlgH family protein [Myxococcota bacterium]